MCPGRQGEEENAGNGGRDCELDNVGVWGDQPQKPCNSC